jgi:hypothetical protein
VRVGEPDDLAETVQSVTNHRRRVPVGRKLLRLLARESRPVFVATALGHLLRCMYYRNRMCRGNGLCKATWIATVFEVDKWNVRLARAELVEKEVLFRLPAGQHLMNRDGVPMCFNFRWGEEERKTPPPAAISTTGTPPPIRTGNSSSRRSENQNSVAPTGAGVRKRTDRAPKLSRVLPIDLLEPKRLLVLHGQAKRAGFVGDSEAERLKFFAAAEHALAYGKRNRPGLFAAIVRQGYWSFLSLRDEDGARRTLAACWTEVSPQLRRVPRAPPNRDTETPEEVRALVARSLGLPIDR